MIGRKKNWGEESSILGQEKEEGLLVSKIKDKGKEKDMIIISVYNSRKKERLAVNKV